MTPDERRAAEDLLIRRMWEDADAIAARRKRENLDEQPLRQVEAEEPEPARRRLRQRPRLVSAGPGDRRRPRWPPSGRYGAL